MRTNKMQGFTKYYNCNMFVCIKHSKTYFFKNNSILLIKISMVINVSFWKKQSDVKCDDVLVEGWLQNNYHKPELYPPGGTRLAFFCSGAGSDWAETCWAGVVTGLAASYPSPVTGLPSVKQVRNKSEVNTVLKS